MRLFFSHPNSRSHLAALCLLLATAAWAQIPASQPAPAPGTPPPAMLITLEQAIDLATRSNPTLQANRTLISQNKEQEVTANLRPNPLLSWDAQYLPLFSPSLWSSNYIDTTAQFDLGVGYLFERGQKRQRRLQAARDVTAVTEAHVLDAERTTVANTAQQFVAALLAKSNLDLALQLLASYQHSVGISQEKYNAGGLAKVDLLKVELQTLQFQSDVSVARIARVQALASLRQLLGYDSVPRDYDVAGELVFTPLSLKLEDLQARALSTRPDLVAARRNVASAQSQINLAKANAKQDLNATFNYGHVNASNVGAFYFNIPLPIFNRNQGEVARTYYVLSQSQYMEKAAEQQVLTDIKNAYEALLTSQEVVQLYNQGYLQQAQQALEITQFSYQHGAASLLDFLDAERSYRATELGYRQALAAHMNALEQLRMAVGTRDLQ
ncbi:MAG: TolC family protein [Acidobacteriota bacterium]|nr:TolC family protein [Acidobacteriota bacterium]